MAELTKEMQEAIDNYGARIKTLKDFVTAVRKRPGYHAGAIGTAGQKNLCREILQNAIDQILEPNSPCQGCSFFYDERSLECCVEDNGLGIPFDDLVRVFSSANTSKNYEKKPYQYSSGMHGAGAKVVNALSEIFIVESYRYDGTAVKMEFKKGYPVYDKPKKIPNKEKRQGTKVYFIPDPEIMGNMNLSWKELYILIKRILSQTPIGSYCNFSAIDINGKKFNETIINKDGILAELIMNVKNPIIKPISILNDDGYCRLNLVFCYDAGAPDEGPSDREFVTAFSNFCETVGGTHITGTLDGICTWFCNYMNNIYLANQKSKNNKLKVTPADIKNGLNVMISAACLEAVFSGQAKDILSNEEMKGFAKNSVIKGLDEWSKANPQDLGKIAKFFKDMAEVRTREEGAKAKVVTKYAKSTLNNLPAKYIRPLTDKDTELIIVEGDSALGTVHLARDPKTQGLFPIRGKIANAFKTSKQAFFNNEEVQAITQIIFRQDYKRGLTLEDAKVSKIIFMADADVDGAHIAALLLRMFVMYYPFLIDAGMVYKAVPPLFSAKEGKKTKYFTEQIDIVKYIQKNFLASNTLAFDSKNQLSSRDITLFFLRNADYIYFLEKVANTYAVDPYLLELVLNHYVNNKKSIKVDKLNKEVNAIFRFMNATKSGSNVIVKGTIAKSNLIIINDKFLADCFDILRIIDNNDRLIYLLNNKKSTIYSIMKAYEASMPNNVQRYKGLGEMDKEELAESTLYPGSDRTLVRYTMESAKETLETIREYESNSKKILTLVNNVTRDDLAE